MLAWWVDVSCVTVHETAASSQGQFVHIAMWRRVKAVLCTSTHTPVEQCMAVVHTSQGSLAPHYNQRVGGLESRRLWTQSESLFVQGMLYSTVDAGVPTTQPQPHSHKCTAA